MMLTMMPTIRQNLKRIFPLRWVVLCLWLAPIAYAFFLFLIFTIFGGKGKYWWIGILTLPALAFELYFDLSHIYFPVFLALLGWLIGLGIQKIVLKPKRN